MDASRLQRSTRVRRRPRKAGAGRRAASERATIRRWRPAHRATFARFGAGDLVVEYALHGDQVSDDGEFNRLTGGHAGSGPYGA
jgi:hypothetical protein